MPSKKNSKLAERRWSSHDGEGDCSDHVQSEKNAEKKALLKRMETLSIKTMLKTYTELMEEFNARKHIEWDPDDEIDFDKSFLAE